MLHRLMDSKNASLMPLLIAFLPGIAVCSSKLLKVLLSSPEHVRHGVNGLHQVHLRLQFISSSLCFFL
ncbi:hypothetical protein ILYODFUR_028621 [Ilyodon furcidens]|uniref:Uncharacterized protein n=1 Tax=Ilyodon furcidens TaxID=33524 RepID=A0ABV0TBU3_9TELE